MIYRGAFSSNDLLKYQPTGDGPNSITLGELMKLNKDVVGWIKIFDTHISYPVVQGKDNQEYLNKDVFGEFSFSGSIFLDYRNACDFTDSYSIIYGHHMEYGAMFGDVVEFKNDELGFQYFPYIGDLIMKTRRKIDNTYRGDNDGTDSI